MHRGHAHTLRSHRANELDELVAKRTRVGVMVWGEISGYTLGPDGNPNTATILVEWPNSPDTSYPVRISGIDILHPSDADD